jgi:hypothetical protein
MPRSSAPLWVRSYRIVCALLTLIAIGWQLYTQAATSPTFRASNFLRLVVTIT